MISFYTSNRNFRDPYNNPQAGPIVPLNGSQIANVAAFIRVLNADENSRQAIELISYALQLRKRKDKRLNIKLAVSEIEDAIRVLQEGRLHSIDVVPLFTRALTNLQKKGSIYLNRRRLGLARAALWDVREIMITRQ